MVRGKLRRHAELMEKEEVKEENLNMIFARSLRPFREKKKKYVLKIKINMSL